MHNRLILAGLAATGGLLTTAFLQVAVAVADAGADAFTIGGFTFDPQLAAGGEGFDPVAQLTTSPPLLELGGGTALGLPLADQDFNVYDPTSGTELGSIEGNETDCQPLRLDQYRVHRCQCRPDPPAALTRALPTVGSVYDVFNLGNGYENVYTATPDVAADGLSPWHRHRHADDAIRRRQPGLAVRLQRRRPAQPRRRVHGSRRERNQRRYRRFQHRRLHARPAVGGWGRGLRHDRPAGDSRAAVGDRRRLAR